MYVEQIYTGCLAQASYYIESNGEAVIVDPIRDSAGYIQLLETRNAKLKYILETHFHADFVSGHLELDRLTEAKIVFGPSAETSYDIINCTHEQEFIFGNLKIRALHTPGHTLESVSYLLLSSDNSPEAVFTGDTLFVGEVGRPDLVVNSDLKAEYLAGLLYDSLNNVLMKLPESVIVYPGHGAGSACGKNISTERLSTIGEQKKMNYALQKMSKSQFINLVLEGILPPPQYFPHDVLLNKEGYEPTSFILKKSLKKLSNEKIQSFIDNGAVVLDVRMPSDFERGFIPNAINIGKTGMFAPWVGSIISPESDIILVCYSQEEEEVISRLARIGYHKVIGYTYGISDWQSANYDIDSICSLHPTQNMFIDNNNKKIIDVRNKSELVLGFVEHSIHIPLNNLLKSLDQINQSDDYLIYCAGGYRSMIACSILKSKGYKNVQNIYGGFSEISKNLE
tara:strand:- start:8333 stop:9691 length:1359 start_codon:yes stop_codon:yes gene_type:complete